MRSRYAAYAKSKADYIIETTDPDGPRWQDDLAAWRDSIASFAASCLFDGVEIVDSSTGVESASVTFVARLSRRGTDVSFAEKSAFVMREGRWFYRDGEVETSAADDEE